MGLDGLLGLCIGIVNGSVHVVFDDNRRLAPINIEVVQNALVDPSLADTAIVRSRLLLLLLEWMDLFRCLRLHVGNYFAWRLGGPPLDLRMHLHVLR